MFKMKILEMKAGTKFYMGSTPCMKLAGHGSTGHVSLITGVINFAVLDLEDEFEVFTWSQILF